MKTNLLYYILVLLISFSALQGIAQEENPDSLKTVLDRSEKKDKIRIYNELAQSYQVSDPEKSLTYGLKALELALQYGDKEAEALAFENMGAGYVFSKDYERALDCYNQAWTKYDALGKDVEAASTLNNIGLTKHFMKDYDEAIDYFERAQVEFKELGEPKSSATTMNNIANVYLNLDRKDKALEYYSKSLDIKKELKDDDGVKDALTKIGLLYKSLNQNMKALRYLTEALEIPENEKKPKQEAQLLTYIGDINILLENSQTAIEFYEKSYEKFFQNQEEEGACGVMIKLSKILIEAKKYNEAGKKLEKALVLANRLDEQNLEKEIYYNYYLLYSKRNDYKNALKYYEQYSKLKDVLLNEEFTLRLVEMKIDLDNTNKKSKSVKDELSKKSDQLVLYNTYVNQLSTQKHNILLISLISVTLLLIIVVYLFYNMSKAKKEEHKLVDLQNNYNLELKNLETKIENIKKEKEKIQLEKEKLNEINNAHDDFYEIVNSKLKETFTSLMHYTDTMVDEIHAHGKEEIKEAFFHINKEASEGLKVVENIVESR